MFINSPLVVANFTVKSHRGDLRVPKTTTNRSRIEPNVNLFQWRNSPERQVCTAAGAGRIGALPLDASRDVETAPRPPAVPRANRTEVNIFNIFSPKKNVFGVFLFFSALTCCAYLFPLERGLALSASAGAQLSRPSTLLQ